MIVCESPFLTENASHTIEEGNTCTEIDADVTEAIFKAFSINEEMGGSQKNLLDIVYYGRDLYCKKNPAAINRWPHSYSACLQILKKAGYNDPVVHYICLDPMQSSSSVE